MNDPIEITPEYLRLRPLPVAEGGDKNQRGRIFVIAGSLEVPGAALLSATAALRAGAGRLQIATPPENALALGLSVPEALVMGFRETDASRDGDALDELCKRAAECRAVLVGPGMMDSSAAAALTAALLEKVHGPAFVLDAAALKNCRTCAGAIARHSGRVILTPHAGEMAGMLDVSREEVEADPWRYASEAAAEFGAIVALKGATTHISIPDGRRFVNHWGNVGLATSGSGDVLAGVIAGLLARGVQPADAACWGVFLHADAGVRLARRIGLLGYLARELLEEIAPAMAELSR